MDIILFANLICISMLIIASIQDFLKKSVSDFLHYLLIVFSISLAIYGILLGYVPRNIIFSYLILVFFFLMYLLRFLAIGDIYIMFFLFYFLANLEFQQILKFLIMLAVGGVFVHSLEAIKIFYKKREKNNILIISFSVILSFISGFLFSLSISNLLSKFYLFLISSFLLLISTLILKFYEERIKKELTFERTVDELVEGDWIENEIKINKIPEEMLNEIKNSFFIVKEGDYYLIKLKNNKKIFRFIVLTFLITPILFHGDLKLFLVFSILAILILTIFHDKIFRDDLGLSKKQIDLLKKIVDKNTKFIVREGAPFVPAITFAYILSLI